MATIAPSQEALSAIVARINSGEDYVISVRATAAETEVDVLEDLTGVGLRVDVVQESEQQLRETLGDDPTSHALRVLIRQKVDSVDPSVIDPLKLVVRQIHEQLDDWNSADRRVCVWECSLEPNELPIKSFLNDSSLFVASIVLIVEVAPS